MYLWVGERGRGGGWRRGGDKREGDRIYTVRVQLTYKLYPYSIESIPLSLCSSPRLLQPPSPTPPHAGGVLAVKAKLNCALCVYVAAGS
jgi:hypothetical protein